MANTIRLNAASLNRPGVFVTQTSSGGVPEPIANHAVGYIFGTTPTEDYYGDNAIGSFSEFVPYTPTQVASTQDFLEKVGGTVPVGNKGALATYDAIRSFFDNVGVNGILYFTRVTPTPETVIDLKPSAAGAGYNAFALKVNGRYYGTPIGINDNEGTEIKVITTTALDQVDNARDLFTFLSSDLGDGFSDYYRVEQTDTEATLGKFRIFSRDSRSLPRVNKFFAYQFSDTLYASPLNLDNETIVKFYTSVKEINFRCTSRDQTTGEPILFLSGSSLSEFVDAANTLAPGTYAVATDQSDIIKDFLVNQGIYESNTSIPDDKIVAVSKDLTSNADPANKWLDASAVYWRYDLGTETFAKIQSTGVDVVPTGTVVQTGDIETRNGYLPDSVQVFYVNVAGENRAIIVNGSTPDALTIELIREINSILVEKGLDGYYTVEAVDSETEFSADTFVPNNGHQVSELISEAGAPYIRPELTDISLTGTVTVTAGALSGAGTLFETQIAPGDVVVINGTRFTVSSITNNLSAVVTPANVTVASPTSFALDKSIPNGFYSHDYVLKIKITSNNGISSPINAGLNRLGITDSNVIKLISQDQSSGYESYKISTTAKVNDFVYAIETGMESRALSPGFVFSPEAYTVTSYEVGGDLASKTEARAERLKITQSLLKVAEGRVGQTEGITGTQHIALIDCGADEESLSDVRDELDLVKSNIGVPFGHAAFYAPYVKNIDGRFIAPSSYVAGIACSRYINEGFQQPPAGSRYPLRGATGLKLEISAQQQEVTYALGLNPIRSLPNRGIVAWGSRTLASNPLFKFVNTRAILNVLIDVLGRSFDDILFEKIDSAGTVFARVKSIASQVLGQFYRAGALYGNRPEQAYLVVCSSANNSEIDFENGTVRLDVFVATSPTLERLPITIIRTPTGQVAQISDSFSRNEERFSYLLDTTSSII